MVWQIFDGTSFALFFVACWALIVSPGPDMLYVITRGIAQGRTAGLLSAFGVTSGLLVHTLFAALGLSVLLQTSSVLFSLVKYAGAVYLLVLGIRAFRDTESLVLDREKQPMSLRSIYIQGVLSNVLNPKVALFFLAFLPQFVDSGSDYAAMQMAVLGIVFTIFGILFLSVVGYFSGYIGSWIAERPNLTSKLRWVTGGALVGLAARLALTKQR
jgi:threonine/homoserine/homoserine lactone efflux protein